MEVSFAKNFPHMITILSPAKTLDFDSSINFSYSSIPDDVDVSEKIIKKLRSTSKKRLKSLMGISKELVELNALRYEQWDTSFSEKTSRPALLTFAGEVYRGLNAQSFNQEELDFANEHLRLLSGLHGILKPMDRIQPYRLEMKTRLSVGRKKNLYELWTDRVTNRLNMAMEKASTDTLINLASNEYSKAVDFSKINGRVITPIFMDRKNGEYKVVMTWAKTARGIMARFIVQNRISNANDLIGFDEYRYNEPLSTSSDWVFTRD